MFTPEKTESDLQKAYNRALLELKNHEPDSKEYGAILDKVVTLHTMRDKEIAPRVSRDTLLKCAANILGILLVTKFEYSNVITTKAFGLLNRP